MYLKNDYITQMSDLPRIFESKEALVRMAMKDGHRDLCTDPKCNHFVLYVTCSCGKSYPYRNVEEIPAESLYCSACEQALILYGA